MSEVPARSDETDFLGPGGVARAGGKKEPASVARRVDREPCFRSGGAARQTISYFFARASRAARSALSVCNFRPARASMSARIPDAGSGEGFGVNGYLAPMACLN